MAIISGDLTPANLNDVLTGTAGADTITGGLGSDTINGAASQDLVDYFAAPNSITFDIGQNVVIKTPTTQDILSNIEIVKATTAPGSTIDGSSLSIPDGLTIDLAASSASYLDSQGVTVSIGVENFTNAIGTSANDIITGDAANNTFIASNGTDNYVGGAGTDVLDYTQLPVIDPTLPPTRITYGVGTGAVEKQGIGEDIFQGVENIIAPTQPLTLLEQQQLQQGQQAGSILDLSGAVSGVTYNTQTGALVGGATFGGTNTYSNFDSIIGTGFADTFIVGGSRDVSITLGGTSGAPEQVNIANPGQGKVIITDFIEGDTIINLQAQPGLTTADQLTISFDPINNNTTFSLPTGQEAFTLIGINFDQALNVISNDVVIQPVV